MRTAAWATATEGAVDAAELATTKGTIMLKDLTTRCAVAVTAAGVVAATLCAAAPASSAAALPSNCPRNQHIGTAYLRLCLYYDGNGAGALYKDASEATPDFAGKKFGSSGDGAGQYVKNNAASAGNASGFSADVFYNEHCSGPYDSIAAYTLKNLVQTWNDEASYENPFLNDGTVGGC